MSNLQKISSEISKIIEIAAAQAHGLSEEETFQLLDDAYSKCIEITGTQDHVLEVERRVLEWKAKLLCDMNAPLVRVEKILFELEKAGYSDLYCNSNIKTYYADFCFRNNHKQEGFKALDEIITILNEDLERMPENSEMQEYFLGYAKELRDKNLTKLPT